MKLLLTQKTQSCWHSMGITPASAVKAEKKIEAVARSGSLATTTLKLRLLVVLDSQVAHLIIPSKSCETQMAEVMGRAKSMPALASQMAAALSCWMRFIQKSGEQTGSCWW